MRISFVVLTWNRSEMLKICLDQLANAIQNKHLCEIIIFDNASTDDTRTVLEDFYKKFNDFIDIKYYISINNLRLRAYKQLFKMATGDIVIEVDDDVLAFPENIDSIFVQYFNEFQNFGFLALDVIQNEYTNGAKPHKSYYSEVVRNNLIIEEGPTGGWCAGFRLKDFKKIQWIFNLLPISMKSGEDGALVNLMKLIGKKSGIIKDKKCFHACGSYYSKQYNLLERDIEKYSTVGLNKLVENYRKLKDE